MNEYKILDLLSDEESNDFDFTAAYDGKNYYIFSTSYFNAAVRMHFTSYVIGLYALTVDDAKSEFKNLFNLFKSYRGETYARRAAALDEKYKVFGDMDITETKTGNSTTTNDTTDRRTLDTTDSTTLDTTDTTTHGTTDTTTHGHTTTENIGVYGVNSATAVNSDTTTTTEGGTDTVKTTGTDTVSRDGTDTTKHTGTDTTTHGGTVKVEDGYTIHRYGDDGNTDYYKVLTDDLKLLSTDLPYIAVRDFIGRYAYMIGGLDI